jgi:hypothetical protein
MDLDFPIGMPSAMDCLIALIIFQGMSLGKIK